MGGIGITIHSQESTRSPSTPITSLPKKVVDEIARQLGISEPAQRALASGKLDLPDDVDVKLTRLSNSESCTVRKLSGGATYRITYRDKTVDVTL